MTETEVEIKGKLIFWLVMVLLVMGLTTRMRYIGPGETFVRVHADGAISAARPGWQFLPPHVVLYPVGNWMTTITAHLETGDGGTVRAVFRYELLIPPSSVSHLHSAFSKEFQSSFRKLVIDAASTTAGSLTDSSSKVAVGAVQNSVRADVESRLREFGVRVNRGQIVSWTSQR